MAATSITRVTLFNVPNLSDQEKLLALYKDMPSKAVKDSQPYILSVAAGHCGQDDRARGYTVVAVSKFASLADMRYYEDGCAAHAELRTFAARVRKEFAVAWFEDVVGS